MVTFSKGGLFSRGGAFSKGGMLAKGGPFAHGTGGVLVTLAPGSIIADDSDSTHAGQLPSGQLPANASLQATSGPAAKLANLLAADGIKVSDDGWFGDHGSWGTAQSIANYAAGDGRFAYTGAANLSAQKPVGGNGFYANATGSWTLTPRRPVRKWDVYWLDNSVGRNLTATSGTSGAVAMNTTGGSSIMKTTIDSGSVGINPLVIAWAAGGGSNWFGAFGYDDMGGMPVRIYNWAISGANASVMIDNTAPTTTSRLAQHAYHGADLTFIGGGINDARQSISVATFKANTGLRIDSALAGKVGAKVILETQVHDPSSTGNAANQEQYATAIRELGVERNLPLLDVRAAWQSHAYAVSRGWAQNGDVHPLDAGFAMWGGLRRRAIRIAA